MKGDAEGTGLPNGNGRIRRRESPGPGGQEDADEKTSSRRHRPTGENFVRAFPELTTARLEGIKILGPVSVSVGGRVPSSISLYLGECSHRSSAVSVHQVQPLTLGSLRFSLGKETSRSLATQSFLHKLLHNSPSRALIEHTACAGRVHACCLAPRGNDEKKNSCLAV